MPSSLDRRRSGCKQVSFLGTDEPFDLAMKRHVVHHFRQAAQRVGVAAQDAAIAKHDLQRCRHPENAGVNQRIAGSNKGHRPDGDGRLHTKPLHLVDQPDAGLDRVDVAAVGRFKLLRHIVISVDVGAACIHSGEVRNRFWRFRHVHDVGQTLVVSGDVDLPQRDVNQNVATLADLGGTFGIDLRRKTSSSVILPGVKMNDGSPRLSAVSSGLGDFVGRERNIFVFASQLVFVEPHFEDQFFHGVATHSALMLADRASLTAPAKSALSICSNSLTL